MAGRRYTCACGKKRYRDEAAALAAAAEDRQAYGDAVRVYRCPGGLAWHLTAHGFTPGALRPVARRLAAELLERGEVDLEDFVMRLRDDRRRARAERCAAQMRALGLVDDRWRARDRAGLARVVQIGLDAYAAERTPD